MKTTKHFGVFLMLLAASVQAERYYVTEDSFGNVDANQEEREFAQSVSPSPNKSKALQSGTDKSVSVQHSEPAPLPRGAVGEAIEQVSDGSSEPARSMQPQEAAVDDKLESLAKSLSKQSVAGPENTDRQQEDIDFPALPSRAPLAQESELERDARVDDNPFTRAFRQSEGQNPYDATQVDEQEYIDGYDLLEGRIQQPSRQPFFVTRDLDGNEQITFYSPTLAKEARDKAQTEPQFSEATIYSANSEKIIQARLPADADPQALAILMSASQSQDDYFTGFAKHCCEHLPKAGVKVLQFGRSEHLRLTEELLPYRFTEGDSRYLIFKLPTSKEDYVLELRAFIRKYKAEGVSHGVFFPQLVTLSKSLKPLRIITNPVLSYSPETWSSYAYLQGVFEVDRTKGQEEEYMLVNTTREQLKLSSQYYVGEQLVAIEHMKYGSLGVKVSPLKP